MATKKAKAIRSEVVIITEKKAIIAAKDLRLLGESLDEVTSTTKEAKTEMVDVFKDALLDDLEKEQKVAGIFKVKINDAGEEILDSVDITYKVSSDPLDKDERAAISYLKEEVRDALFEEQDVINALTDIDAVLDYLKACSAADKAKFATIAKGQLTIVVKEAVSGLTTEKQTVPKTSFLGTAHKVIQDIVEKDEREEQAVILASFLEDRLTGSVSMNIPKTK